MKKLLAVLLSLLLSSGLLTVNVLADEAQDVPAQFTKMKIFSGTYGFGDADIIALTTDSEDEFYFTFETFGEVQIVEGTVDDGIVDITYDQTGFMAFDAQYIWDDAVASENPWEPVTEDTVIKALPGVDSTGESAEDAQAADPEEAAEGESAAGESAEDESADSDSGESESAESETAVDIGNDTCAVTVVHAGENEVLVVYPRDNIAETSDVLYITTAPMLIVYGDQRYDAESAIDFVNVSGLGEIAKTEGSSVCIVNPVEDSWSDADAASYENIVGLVSNSSTEPSMNGIMETVNYFTGGTSLSIAGATDRMYLYGFGSGADFVAANFLKQLISTTTFPDGVSIEFDRTATTVTLVDPTDVSSVEENDFPVALVGGNDEIKAILEEKCGSLYVDEEPDFVKEFYIQSGMYRRQVGRIIPITDYAAAGIIESIESWDVPTAADNAAFAGTETHKIGYVVYYSEDLDVAAGNVPLVMCFHGGGGTAFHEAMMTGLPELGREEGFMTVSVDLHYPNFTATEIVSLIGHLQEEYSIDPGRIYATGFSMGGCRSWDMYEQYPEVFAGIAPMDASFEPGTDANSVAIENYNQDVIVPLFYVGGEASPLAELPCQSETLVNRMTYVFPVQKLTKKYDVSFEAMDTWEDPFWGVAGDLTYGITDTIFTDSQLSVDLFQSEDGKYYTALAVSGNQSHEIYSRNSKAAWDFLKQFSRAGDGSIVIDEITYSLGSDDGSVIDNSYNR